jgi:glycine cleavage system H lipoate-binding protein
MVILIVLAFVVMVITIDAIVHFSRNKDSKISAFTNVISRVFNEDSIMIPKGMYYDKTHTWAFIEKNGLVKIGIDDFLLHITGPFIRIKMKTSGDKIIKGEPLFSIIQNGKQLTINAPISGNIKSINEMIIDDSNLVSTSNFNDGWIYTIEPTNWVREIQFLYIAESYKEWIKNEFLRLKDFFASIRMANNPDYSAVVLQDGGELKDNILSEFGPEVWEDFQTKFINTSR